jgi:hypothetical protein
VHQLDRLLHVLVLSRSYQAKVAGLVRGSGHGSATQPAQPLAARKGSEVQNESIGQNPESLGHGPGARPFEDSAG